MKIIIGTDTETYLTDGSVTYSGFPSTTLTAAATLSINCSVTFLNATGTAKVVATIGSTSTTLLTATAVTAQTTYTLAIPSGTDLSTVSVTISTDMEEYSARTARIMVSVYEIYIQ